MSNINNITGAYEQNAYITETVEKNKQVRPEADAPARKDASEDRVSLSAGSKEMSLAKQAAMEDYAPPVPANDRAEKVAGIKEDVESGQYQPDADMAADKIIGLVIDEMI